MTSLLLADCAFLCARCGRLCTSNEAQKLKLIPWAGTALKLPGAFSFEEPIHLAGAAFAFLPLPIKTGLPVHINGSFELAPDRERIWTRNERLQGEAAIKAEWNHLLLRDVITLCYHRLLDDAKSMVSGKQFFTVWPQEAQEPYDSLIRPLYDRIGRDSAFFPVRNTWEQLPIILRAEQYADSEDPERPGWKVSLRKSVSNVLQQRSGLRVIDIELPTKVKDHLSASANGRVEPLTPKSARQYLWASRNEQWLHDLSKTEGVAVLSFCVHQEPSLSGLGTHRGADWATELNGLRLLPVLPRSSQFEDLVSGPSLPATAKRHLLLQRETLRALCLVDDDGVREGIPRWIGFLHRQRVFIDSDVLTKQTQPLLHLASPPRSYPHATPARLYPHLANVVWAEKTASPQDPGGHVQGGPPIDREAAVARISAYAVCRVLAVPELTAAFNAWADAPENAEAVAEMREWILGSYQEWRQEKDQPGSELLFHALRLLHVLDLPEPIRSADSATLQRDYRLVPLPLDPAAMAPRGLAGAPDWWRALTAAAKEIAGPHGENWLLRNDPREHPHCVHV